MKTLMVIDIFGFLFRSFHALPPLKSKEGFPTGLLTGFANFINSLVSEHTSDYIVFALDSEGPSFRAQIDPSYKAQRPQPPQELKEQLLIAIEWIKKMGFATLAQEGMEADDIIASLVRCVKENKKEEIKVIIVSHDKDLYQLIEDGRVVLYNPIRKEEIDEQKALKKFGVPPKHIGDYLALVGDSADNIVGVRGIGPKTAAKLINQFGSLEAIYENLEKVEPLRVRKLLEEGKQSALRSKRLVLLNDKALQSCDLQSYRVPTIHPLVAIADELIKFDITAVLQKIEQASLLERQKRQKEFKAVCLNNKKKLFETVEQIPDGAVVAFDIETDGLDTKQANLVGFSFAWQEEIAYYVPIGHNYLGVGEQVALEDGLEAIRKLLNYKIVGHNLKFDLGLLYRYGVPRAKEFVDTMILAWLLDPQSSIKLESLAKRFFDYDMISFKETVKKGEDFSGVPIEKACVYAAEDAVMTYLLYFELLDQFKSRGITHLLDEAKEVEFPLVNILIDMERAGIKIDIPFFEKLQSDIAKQLEDLTQKIYELAGEKFNINSTKQLAQLLFEKLSLPPLKRTKTGYSTDEATLEALKGKHPLIEKILEYRELFKLKSTYIDPLINYAKKDAKHRIYTTFIQTGTATGRLASKNPNLQNIPIKTELGRQIRQGFIAQEGYRFVGIDYSQIELRLLAHLSKDPALIQAFEEDRDIHLETAIKLFGQERAQQMRNVAKSINFGLIYGMGSRKLAQTLGISPKEAKQIIENYFRSFPTVKEYLRSIEEFAKSHGYVQTLLGRRRYFDFASASGAEFASFLREAINTVVQGSVADLIKLAMRDIDEIFQKEHPKASMLLQIHDELVFEIQESQAADMAEHLRRVMENVYKLEVPIRCSVGIAKRWGELK